MVGNDVYFVEKSVLKIVFMGKIKNIVQVNAINVIIIMLMLVIVIVIVDHHKSTTAAIIIIIIQYCLVHLMIR